MNCTLIWHYFYFYRASDSILGFYCNAEWILKEFCRLVFKCDFKKQFALLCRVYTVSFVKNGAMKSWNNEYSLCTALQQTNSLQRLEMILLLFQTQQVHLKSFSTEIQNTILLFYLKTVIWTENNKKRAENWMLCFDKSKKSAIFLIILRRFLVIFLTPTFILFTKLKIWRSFWGAEQV